MAVKQRREESEAGFTLIELLFVVSIITFVSSFLVIYTIQARVRARDVRRLTDKNQIIKALHLAETDTGGDFPSSGFMDLGEGIQLGEWSCFGVPASEQCWRNSFSGYDTLASIIKPQFRGSIPRPAALPGSFAYNSYLYISDHPGWSDGKGDHPPGTYLIWPKEEEIKSSECNPNFIYRHDENYWYCYEWLGE
ncbi:MAG: type II secretion system protein [Candidatus Sungbacteria bacterium]|nr:type II secretion system protein [Candidatus Sungbacteria bacterium]